MTSKLVISCIITMGCLPPSAQAHDIYAELINQLGESCCSDHDCRPTPYRISNSGVQMFVEGGWIDVPENKVQYRALQGDTGETGGGHWCGYLDGSFDQWVTRCAFLPPQAVFVSGHLMR